MKQATPHLANGEATRVVAPPVATVAVADAGAALIAASSAVESAVANGAASAVVDKPQVRSNRATGHVARTTDHARSITATAARMPVTLALRPLARPRLPARAQTRHV